MALTDNDKYILIILLQTTKELLNNKYKNRKRLTSNEIWEKATTLSQIEDLKKLTK